MKVMRNFMIMVLIFVCVYILLICAMGLKIPFGAVIVFGVSLVCTLLLIVLCLLERRHKTNEVNEKESS